MKNSFLVANCQFFAKRTFMKIMSSNTKNFAYGAFISNTDLNLIQTLELNLRSFRNLNPLTLGDFYFTLSAWDMVLKLGSINGPV